MHAYITPLFRRNYLWNKACARIRGARVRRVLWKADIRTKDAGNKTTENKRQISGRVRQKQGFASAIAERPNFTFATTTNQMPMSSDVVYHCFRCQRFCPNFCWSDTRKRTGCANVISVLLEQKTNVGRKTMLIKAEVDLRLLTHSFKRYPTL